jgi:hypothetical protein
VLKTSPDGLYVDLTSFLGFSKKYVQLNYEKTGHHLYLHIKRILKKKVKLKKDCKKKFMMGKLFHFLTTGTKWRRNELGASQKEANDHGDWSGRRLRSRLKKEC